MTPATDLVPDCFSNLVYGWETSYWRSFYERLTQSFRLILFDKRGTDLSDRGGNFPTLETRMEDLHAVMAATGSERAPIFGSQEGCSMATLFAATYVLLPATLQLRVEQRGRGRPLRVRRKHARFRGEERDTAGDGFFATFDGPARAVRCAQAIIEAVRTLGLEIRAGVHTGECELHEGKVAGIAVATGARVCSAAGPGEVLVTRTVKGVVSGSGLAFASRDAHELKGVGE